MRTHALVSITALALLAACAGGHADDGGSPSPSPSASPQPLRSCETREMQFDGADLVVQANVDRSVGAIVVVSADNEAARARALETASKLFGEPHPDTRTTSRPSKWGLVAITDMCGRPVRAGS